MSEVYLIESKHILSHLNEEVENYKVILKVHNPRNANFDYEYASEANSIVYSCINEKYDLRSLKYLSCLKII